MQPGPRHSRPSEMARAVGKKATPPRLVVISATACDTAHPTAELQRVDLGSGAVRFGPNTEAHDHFVCVDCGSVADVRAAEPARLSDGDQPQFDDHEAEIVLRERCSPCSTLASAIK